MPNTMLDKAIVDIYNTGFFDYFLPFMVSFAVLYGVLQKTKFFGKESGRTNAVFALVVSLIIMPFAAKFDYTTYASKLVIVVIAGVLFSVILGLFGFDFEKNKKYSVPIAFIAIMAIILSEVFGINFRNISTMNSEIYYLLIILFVFGTVFWAVTRKTKEEFPIVEKKKVPAKEVRRQPHQREEEPHVPASIPLSEIEEDLRRRGIKLDKSK